MLFIPGMLNRLPSVDPMFSEINETADGYYEVGGISRVGCDYNGGDMKITQFDEYQDFSQPQYAGTIKQIARAMFLDLMRHSFKYKWAGPFEVSFYPKTECKYSIAAIPCSRHQKVDTEQFRVNLEAELDKLRILIPFS